MYGWKMPWTNKQISQKSKSSKNDKMLRHSKANRDHGLFWDFSDIVITKRKAQNIWTTRDTKNKAVYWSYTRV